MLQNIANIITIVVLGAGILYSVAKFIRVTWVRIRPVLAAQNMVPRILAGIAILASFSWLFVNVAITVQDTAWLFIHVHRNLKAIESLRGHLPQIVPPQIRSYVWSQGQPPVQMIPTSQGVCFLTHVRGQFEGTGESVSVIRQNDHWYLTGESRQSGVQARANCWILPLDDGAKGP